MVKFLIIFEVKLNTENFVGKHIGISNVSSRVLNDVHIFKFYIQNRL